MEVFSLLNTTFLLAAFAGIVLATVLMIAVSPRSGFQITTVYQTIVIYKQINVQSAEGKTGEGVDGFVQLIVYGGGILLLTFFYLSFSEVIFRWINIFSLASFFFAFSTVFISARRRLLTDSSWWYHIGIPFLAMIFTLYLINRLQENLDSRVTDMAKGASPFEFIKILFTVLTQYGQIFYVFQLFGLITTVFFQLVCLASFIYYIGLLNFRGDKNYSFWKWVIKLSRKLLFSTSSGNIIFIFVLGIISYLFVSGIAAEWLYEYTSTSIK